MPIAMAGRFAEMGIRSQRMVAAQAVLLAQAMRNVTME